MKSKEKEYILTETIKTIGKKAKEAAHFLASLDPITKNKALSLAAELMEQQKKEILAANSLDLKQAKESGLNDAFIDRLELNDTRINGMINSIKEIKELNDPVGKVLASTVRPNGLKIMRVAVPIGVIGIIYESRPNVTSDAASLCLKSGNAVILRSGSESLNSSMAIVKVFHEALDQAGIPTSAIQIIQTKERQAVTDLLKATEYVDLIIPRGGLSLTKLVSEESKVPTLLHLTGNCHTYIHENADFAMARKVLINAKMRRTGICGATESLLIDEKIASQILPLIVNDFTSLGCEIRGDIKALSADKRLKSATEEDFGLEYLAPILSVKIVSGISEAIEHINKYGSHHTDSIITEDKDAASLFFKGIDSSIVMHNTSTQFADGGEFGMGAEIGIATGKLHARGPVGVEQLTTYKYIVQGAGQIRPN
jgi:glutamate-5-semialdehyde dehydrogenase